MADPENVSEAKPTAAVVTTTSPSEQKEQLERRSSKSRLYKQDEVEEDEDHSPSSENSDATIVPTVGPETPIVTPPDDSSPEAISPDESQPSIEPDKSSPTQLSHPKVKLVRSHALRDDASPPPDEPQASNASPPSSVATTTITVTPATSVKTQDSLELPDPIPQRTRKRGKLEKSGSGSASGSFSDVSPVLSRDSSVETQYTDSTGINLEEFIANTLNKNAKDRIMLLKLEQDLTSFIKDNKHFHLKFPQMTSYHRMLVHRVAAFFGLDHNVDQSGKSVYVNRTANTRLPDFRFRDHIRDEVSGGDEMPKKQILKRESASLDDSKDCHSPERMTMEGKKSKSFEERAEDYRKAKERIFNQESNSSQEGGLLESPPSHTSQSSTRSSKEDLRPWAEPRQWSSTDSSGYGTDTSSKHKVSVTKAGSFGGMTVLMRDNKGASRLASKSGTADSLSSGNSSNIGSPMTRPPTIPSSPPPSSEFSESSESATSATSPVQALPHQSGPVGSAPFQGDLNQVLWVASSVESIPPGSIIINPQTGQPYCNADGTYYRYNPQVPQPHPHHPPHHPHHHQHHHQHPHQSQTTSPGPPHPQPHHHHHHPQQQQVSYIPPPPSAAGVASAYPPYTVVSPGQNTFTSDSGTSDLTHSFSSLSVSPQSVEGQQEHPAAALLHQQPPPPHQQQQHMYMLASPPSDPAQAQHQQPGAPPAGYPPPPAQMHSQPQMSYYGSQQMRLPSPGVTYMGMPGQSGPQQGHIHAPAQMSDPHHPPQPAHMCQPPPANNAQDTPAYPGATSMMNPYSGYQVMSYQGDPYSHQGMYPPMPQHQQQVVTPTGHQPPHPGSAPQPLQPADMALQQTFSSPPLYQPGSVAHTVTPGGMCMYYSVSNGNTSPQVMTYTNPMSMLGQGSLYRPRTPPSQQANSGITVTMSGCAPGTSTMVATGMPPGGAANVPPAGLAHSQFSLGQSLTSPPQYLQYSLYQQQPPSIRPQNPQSGMLTGTYGHQGVPPASSTASTSSQPQSISPAAYNPQIRPPVNMTAAGGAGLQAQTHTTPPPPPMHNTAGLVGHYAAPGLHMPPQPLGGAGIKLHHHAGGKEGGGSNSTPPLMQMQPSVNKQMRALTPPYRSPASISPSDVRLLGTPLQQQIRPPMPLIFQPRQRLMGTVAAASAAAAAAAVGNGNHHHHPSAPGVSAKSGRSRRSWTRNNSRDNAGGVHRNTADGHDMGAARILEVFNLPSGIKRCEADSLLSDLSKYGLRLQYIPEAKSPNKTVNDCHIYAIFDSDSTAQRVLTNHKNPKYKLRQSNHKVTSDLTGVEGLS